MQVMQKLDKKIPTIINHIYYFFFIQFLHKKKPTIINYILLDSFNTSWNTGQLPRDWKDALIIPIRKQDKPANDPGSYRPIALTSISCKLYADDIII